jgi:hypothetical protein
MAKSLFKRDQSSDERIDERLSAYLDGVLALEERVELEARLQHDPALVARLEGLRSTKKALALLPPVEVPRNFVLSPAMVAPPREVAPRRQRRAWPVFGWAAAAVTLAFLLVFAGDIFVVAPSARPKQGILATEPAAKMLVEQEKAADAARAPEAIPPSTQPAQTLFEIQPTTVAVETQAAVVEEIVVESEVTLEKEGAPAAVEQAEPELPAAAAEESLTTARAAATSPPGGGGGERPAPTATEEKLQAPESVAMTETPRLLLKQATPAPTLALGSAAEIEGGAVGSPEPPAAPIEDLEQAGIELPTPSLTDVDEKSETVAVVVPIDVTPDQEAEQDADRVLSWLRWIEAGLALFAIVLATTTLFLRRREL